MDAGAASSPTQLYVSLAAPSRAITSDEAAILSRNRGENVTLEVESTQNATQGAPLLEALGDIVIRSAVGGRLVAPSGLASGNCRFENTWEVVVVGGSRCLYPFYGLGED